jgi:hypothetical protein
MTRTLSHPPIISLDDVQHFAMEDASWDLYEKFLRDIGDRPIRVTYDDRRMRVRTRNAQGEFRFDNVSEQGKSQGFGACPVFWFQ